MDKEKSFEKSNKKCTRCGKQVYKYEEYHISKTKRNTYVVCHKKCI